MPKTEAISWFAFSDHVYSLHIGRENPINGIESCRIARAAGVSISPVGIEMPLTKLQFFEIKWPWLRNR